MERYIKSHLSIGMMGLMFWLLSLNEFVTNGYSLGLLFMIFGGLGFVVSSGYNIRNGNDTKSELELWWLTMSGALLAFLGAIFITID
jgi:hypothetical protein